MPVKPKPEMYGSRVAIIVDAQCAGGTYAGRSHENMILEGILSKECDPYKDEKDRMLDAKYPSEIILEGEVMLMNERVDKHPLKKGTDYLQFDNKDVMAIYSPPNIDLQKESGEQPE